MANGILVVPLENELMNPLLDGIKYPILTPMPMAKNIHRVKFRSKNPSFFRSATGAQCSISIYLSQLYDKY
jgi:hypothetical protein